jgi:hypothetical protein
MEDTITATATREQAADSGYRGGQVPSGPVLSDVEDPEFQNLLRFIEALEGEIKNAIEDELRQMTLDDPEIGGRP